MKRNFMSTVTSAMKTLEKVAQVFREDPILSAADYLEICVYHAGGEAATTLHIYRDDTVLCGFAKDEPEWAPLCLGIQRVSLEAAAQVLKSNVNAHGYSSTTAKAVREHNEDHPISQSAINRIMLYDYHESRDHGTIVSDHDLPPLTPEEFEAELRAQHDPDDDDMNFLSRIMLAMQNELRTLFPQYAESVRKLAGALQELRDALVVTGSNSKRKATAKKKLIAIAASHAELNVGKRTKKV
jgi:hypothetical protein